MILRESYLRRRIPYLGILIPFLLMITMLYLGQAALSDPGFVSLYAVQTHIILLGVATFTYLASEIKLGRQGITKESSWGFLLAQAIGISPVYIFLAWSTPLDPYQDAMMIMYYLTGAAVEELVFRYSLPRYLYSAGYTDFGAHLISNCFFSVLHWFVWNMSPSAFVLGAGFGFANAIAMQLTGSFSGVVWAHALHNLWLGGASGISMAIGTILMLLSIMFTEFTSRR